MSAADSVAVEMEEKKMPVAKRRKPSAQKTADPTAAKKPAKKPAAKAGKPEVVDETPRSSIESVRFENDEAERGT